MQSKRNLFVLILFITLAALFLSACSTKKAKSNLSSLSDSELTQYVIDSGITIPEGIGADTIRGMIVELEEDPDHLSPILGYTLLTDLYEDLRNLVVEYKASGK